MTENYDLFENEISFVEVHSSDYLKELEELEKNTEMSIIKNLPIEKEKVPKDYFTKALYFGNIIDEEEMKGILIGSSNGGTGHPERIRDKNLYSEKHPPENFAMIRKIPGIHNDITKLFSRENIHESFKPDKYPGIEEFKKEFDEAYKIFVEQGQGKDYAQFFNDREKRWQDDRDASRQKALQRMREIFSQDQLEIEESIQRGMKQITDGKADLTQTDRCLTKTMETYELYEGKQITKYVWDPLSKADFCKQMNCRWEEADNLASTIIHLRGGGPQIIKEMGNCDYVMRDFIFWAHDKWNVAGF